jgi:DNA helicase-2/ATP-dependent DNA helicase PcrA
MTDYVEVSYTGDLLAHRRCPRAWAFEKHVGMAPYELVQAMEGRLIHHAMEWLTKRFREDGSFATADEVRDQLNRHFRILWARGIRTAFTSKAETVAGVMGHLYPKDTMLPVVRAVIEGAMHSEYPVKSVRKVLPADFGGKSRIVLTGILDLVVQQDEPLAYPRSWAWTSVATLEGDATGPVLAARAGDVEIWDYKGMRASTHYVTDYVRQVLTYAALYHERTGEYPARCVLFFVNEPDPALQLLAIEVTEDLVNAALAWTQDQVRELQATRGRFEADPASIGGGEMDRQALPPADRVTPDLAQQCTACGLRFDCPAYSAFLTRRARTPGTPSDLDILNVHKN